jgi:hypothetical protein
MLTEEMKTLIRNHPVGMVATINKDGLPAVSPKATFVIMDDQTLAFGNLRSPGTVANLRANTAVEICFIDAITRKAVRVTGTGTNVPKSSAPTEMLIAFETPWGMYIPHMSSFVQIDVSKAEMILSPGYDLGFTEEELKATNLAKLNAL